MKRPERIPTGPETISLYMTPFEIYEKYKKMVRSGYKKSEARTILSDMNLVSPSKIQKLVDQETEEEVRIGQQEYRNLHYLDYSDGSFNTIYRYELLFPVPQAATAQ